MKHSLLRGEFLLFNYFFIFSSAPPSYPSDNKKIELTALKYLRFCITLKAKSIPAVISVPPVEEIEFMIDSNSDLF